MNLFRALLVVMLIGITTYTGITISNHGFNLFPHFFGAMSEMAWQGQFNFDFMTFLTLSGLWTAWRNGFTAAAIALGVAAAVFGIMFMAGYLLFLSLQTNGDARRMLLGVHAGDGSRSG